ncbi:MAG: ribonuclease P protein component [Clostridiales bacterium]|nr:ribonuclease P protein component [Clostridiales bacterium]
MQQQYRIRKNGHFRFVYRKGKHVSGKFFRLHYVKARRVQVGFSVSRQVGKAVTRNLVKRRLRACFRALIPRLQAGGYVITANPEAANASFQDLMDQLVVSARKAGALKPNP